MKNNKILMNLFVFVSLLSLSVSCAFAFDFATLPGITDEQKSDIENINETYKTSLENAEKSIMTYNEKLEKVKNDNDKTDEQRQILVNAYTRTINMYKKQKNTININKDTAYKSILTPEQYALYKMKSTAGNTEKINQTGEKK